MDEFYELECYALKDHPNARECSQFLSDNETISSLWSVNSFSKHYEKELDNQLEKYASIPLQEVQNIKKKRGRKPLRPNDPIRKKTEIKDKYWLRAFRNFVKINFSIIKRIFTMNQLEFWLCYISKAGKPGKDSKFLSYGKNYKAYLYLGPGFLDLFKAWFLEFGKTELSRRYEQGSDLWFIYYDYALKEIADRGSYSNGSQNPYALCLKDVPR